MRSLNRKFLSPRLPVPHVLTESRRDSTLRTECLTKTSLKQVIRKIDFAIGWEYDRWQKELYDPIRECGLWNLPLSPYRDHEFNRQFFGACFEIKADKGSETGSKGRTQIAVWSAAYLRWMYSLCNTLGKNPEDLPPIFAGLVDEGVWTSFIADVTLADDTSTSALGASKISQVVSSRALKKLSICHFNRVIDPLPHSIRSNSQFETPQDYLHYAKTVDGSSEGDSLQGMGDALRYTERSI